MSEPRPSPGREPRLHEVEPGSFVWTADGALPRDVCREAVRRFEASPEEQYPGRIGQTARCDDAVKRSTDLVISGKPQWRDLDRALFASLAGAIDELRQTFAFFRGRFKDMGYALQRTLPGEYYHWHVDGGSHDFADRQMVAIWYLNDVPGPGGETEFRRQAIRVRPVEGRLLLFPPFWTHEHRGVTLERGVKYIATTWIVFA